MEKTEKNLRENLSKRFYPQRAIGYILAFIPLCTIFYLHRVDICYWIFIITGCFIWPHIAYLIGKKSKDPKKIEYRNLTIDSILIGMTLPMISFNLLVSALFFLMHGQNTMGAGGLPLFLKGSLAFIFGTLIVIPLTGIHLNLEANLLIIASCIPVIIVYPMAIAFTAYGLAKNLNKAKNDINAQKEKLEAAHAETYNVLKITKSKEEEITNINQVVQTINSTLDLDTVLAAVANALQHIFLFNQIAVMVIDEQKNELFFEKPYGDGFTADQVEKCKKVKFPLKREVAMCCYAALKNRLYYVPYITPEMVDLFLPADREIYDITLCKSYLFCPLEFQKKVIGVMAFGDTRQSFELTEADLEKIQRYVNQLATAINNARLYAELEKLANLDGLTKIANRRYFNDYINKEWQRLAREKDSLAIILSDIDYFKKYNDSYGHLAGDECLKKVARAISGCLKRPADLAARYGGEEFVLLLPNTDIKGATTVAETIQAEIANLKIPHEQSSASKYISLSIGVSSTIPTHERSSQELINVADQSLYQAKELGRNQIKSRILT